VFIKTSSQFKIFLAYYQINESSNWLATLQMIQISKDHFQVILRILNKTRIASQKARELI
jgi:hypothetical protein